MNLRSLLFILIVTLSFFGIRTWYEKQYQERLEEWKRQHGVEENSSSLSQSASLLSPPAVALFDLPLVYTEPTKNAMDTGSSPALLSTQLIEEITEEMQVKPAFGIELKPGFYLLLSHESAVSWPESLPLSVLKTQQPIESTRSNSIKLLKAFHAGLAVYTDGKFVPSASKGVVAAAISSAASSDYAVSPIRQRLSDPESYALYTGKMTQSGFILSDGSQLSEEAIVFRAVFEENGVSANYLPLGVISHLQNDSNRTKSVLLFDETPFFKGYFNAQTFKPENTNQPAKEQYYALENDYQQIIFSTKNAAIVEINLPFQNELNPKSVVRPISYDEKMTVVSPRNALFPLAHGVQDSRTRDIVTVQGGYYPLLRRDLMSDDSNTVIANVKPQYESCILLPPPHQPQSKQLPPLVYTLKELTPSSIEFQAVDPAGRKITKKYAFPKDADAYPYCIDVMLQIQGGINPSEYMLATGVPEIEWMSGTSGASVGFYHGKGSEKKLERIDLPKDQFTSTSTQADWIFNSNGFFSFIIKPLSPAATTGVFFQRAAGSDAPSRLVELDDARKTFTEETLPGFQAAIGIPSSGISNYRLFAGPLDETILSKIDSSSEKENGTSYEFNKILTFQGWFTFISEPFARLLYFFMKQFHALFGSWALSIVFATAILRVLLYPLNSWSMKSMKRMQEISPLVKAIQEKHKKDPSKAQMEMMALYREKGVNPFSGCLPLLIQMPFLIGMFDLLKSTFQLRGAPFIPGWINDLSAPDVLFHFPITLPLIGNEFHLLPVLLGVCMWLQQAMSSNLPKNPEEWTDQQRQQRSMGTIMTIVMTIMFYNFPSGLNIYWISSMLLGVIQQWWTVDRPMKLLSKRS